MRHANVVDALFGRSGERQTDDQAGPGAAGACHLELACPSAFGSGRVGCRNRYADAALRSALCSIGILRVSDPLFMLRDGAVVEAHDVAVAPNAVLERAHPE